MTTIPLIYAHNHPQPKLAIVHRVIALLLSAMCVTVLVIATRLTPSPTGVETHLQLGLAPCGMLRATGVPCIACGMTTSFSYLAHGQLRESLLAQPAGTVFCFFTAMAAWAGGYVAVTGRPSARLINTMPIQRILWTMLVIALIGWTYKIVAVWYAARA